MRAGGRRECDKIDNYHGGNDVTTPTMSRLLLLSVLIWWYLACSTCAVETYRNARTRFKDTVFVVKYNYRAIPELVLNHIHLWKKVFTTQMIFMPWTNDEVARFQSQNISSRSNITIISHTRDVQAPGYFAYEAAVTAMEKYPHATGYLYAHDDMAMNVSRLMQLDSKHFWFSKYIKEDSCRDLDKNWTSRHNGWWWDGQYGSAAIDNLLGNRTDIADEISRCFNSVHHWCGEQADFFHVPQHYRNSFMRILSAFGKYNIFVEIAVPTYYRCYVKPAHLQPLRLCTSFSQKARNNISHMERFCSAGYPLFHPVKLSMPANFLGMKRKMDLIADPSDRMRDKIDHRVNRM